MADATDRVNKLSRDCEAFLVSIGFSSFPSSQAGVVQVCDEDENEFVLVTASIALFDLSNLVALAKRHYSMGMWFGRNASRSEMLEELSIKN